MQVRPYWLAVLVAPGQLLVQPHDTERCAWSKSCGGVGRGGLERNNLMFTLTGGPAALSTVCQSCGPSALPHPPPFPPMLC